MSVERKKAFISAKSPSAPEPTLDVAIKLNERIKNAYNTNTRDFDAEHALALMYMRTLTIVPNYEKGFRFLLQTAESKQPLHISNLANAYANGVGTPVDMRKAFELYKAAADLNDSNAQCNLSRFYMDSKLSNLVNINNIPNRTGIAADYAKKSAEQGNARGQHLYAIYLLNGLGVAKDKDTALKYLKASIANGDGEAQESLDIFLANQVPFIQRLFNKIFK